MPPDRLTREANILGLALAITLLLLALAVRSVLEDAATRSDAAPAAAERTTDPGEWITVDDYPAAAIRDGLEGTVRIRMTFAPAGDLRSCVVLETSGHASLDRAACDAVARRGTLAQRPESEGDRVITRRIVWRLPEP